MPDPREQAEAVARWCGWETIPGLTIDSVLWLEPKTGRKWQTLPPYASSLDAMRAVEDEIERRGLCMVYRLHLLDAVRERAISLWHSSAEPATFDRWAEYAIATATAAQRLEAAAKVIEEVQS